MIEYLAQEAIGVVVVVTIVWAGVVTVGPALSMGANRGLGVWNDCMGPALVLVLTLAAGALVLAKNGGQGAFLTARHSGHGCPGLVHVYRSIDTGSPGNRTS